MSSRSVYDKAQSFNLSREQVILLYRIAYWFNGRPLEFLNRHRSIGSAYEPTLRQLCGPTWEPEFDEAHDELIRRKFLKTQSRDENIYVAGRPCRWLPTVDSMKVIQHIFADETDLYPDWVLDEHKRPPTFRDGNELLEHRKGTMAARHLFTQLERCSSADVYPRVDIPHRPDLRLWGHGGQLARVEVLTDHNDRESWKEKFIHWTQPTAGATIWVFPNRSTMVTFWNHMLTHTTLELDGGRFGGEANNWSPRRVNDRLRRTRNSPAEYNTIDTCWTIGGLIEADTVDAFEFLKRNNIILSS